MKCILGCMGLLSKIVECFFKHLRRHRMSRAFFPGEEDGGGMPVRRRKEESSLFSGSPHLSSPGYKEEKEEGRKEKSPLSLCFLREASSHFLPSCATVAQISPPSRLKTVASLTFLETHRRPAAWPRARASCWPRSLRRRCSWPCRAPSPG